jgi:mRNA interferase RelE/StbE
LKYNVFWADKRARKSYLVLPAQIQSRLKPILLSLSEQPWPSGVKKLSGRLEGSWRIRVSDWRIVYDIDDKAHTVTILDIGPRKSIYR